MTDEIHAVCSLVAWGRAPAVPGAVVRACATCQRAVWVSPSTLVDVPAAVLVCWDCAPTGAEVGPLIGPTARQLVELAAAGITPAEADAAARAADRHFREVEP
jgi:hypothetical protein